MLNGMASGDFNRSNPVVKKDILLLFCRIQQLEREFSTSNSDPPFNNILENLDTQQQQNAERSETAFLEIAFHHVVFLRQRGL